MNVHKVIFNGCKTVNPSSKLNSFGLKEINGVRRNVVGNNKGFHFTSAVKYPEAKHIPLPDNIAAIMGIEIGQFSPQRSRDITGPVLFSKGVDVDNGTNPRFFGKPDVSLERYDCRGPANLNSSMQTNVPCPFKWQGNAMYLNMPGGQWEQGNKFISEDMQKNYYINNIFKNKKGIKFFHTLTSNYNNPIDTIDKRYQCTKNNNTLSRKEKLKKAVKEYGSTVIVFHVGISLISLGVCYTLVSSGIDMTKFLSYLNLDISSSRVTENASTFVIAYAIHKIFAPVRISITLGSAPFIVRYLRKKGVLKSQTIKN